LGTTLSHAHRQIAWNVSHIEVMYVLFGLAMIVFGWGLWRHIRYWRRGTATHGRFDHRWLRLKLLFKEILWQTKIRDSMVPAVFHSLIFYSFVILVITTTIIALDFDLGTSFFKGYVYVFFTVLAELAGLLILVGVGIAWYRRIRKPKTLPHARGDTIALILIALLVLTGFLVEGLRLAVHPDPWAWLSPVGQVFSFIFYGMNISTGRLMHHWLWWTHTVLGMAWIASIPFTKLFHVLSVPANIYLSKTTPRGELFRFDIEALMSQEDFDAEKFKLGIEKPSDFTWKERLDFDACISCGRCEEVCPATLAKMPFSPRELIANLKKCVHDADQKTVGVTTSQAEEGTSEQPQSVVGTAFDHEYLWYCRTCTACMEVCPARVEHVDTVIDLRRNEVVMQGRVPTEATLALKLLETHGNAFGPQTERSDWIDQLGVRVVAPGESCDVIYWIGCCSVFDPAKRKIATDLAVILQKCGISFGVLGSDEMCCGDPARVLGQEHLFQTIAKKQVEALNARKFKVLLVSCPHCYNVLANEYPFFGGHYRVLHHSEFLHEMLWSGILKPKFGQRRKAVYHDPCYLGRYQKVYEAPREVLKTIPGLAMVEMKNHKNKSLCCGGGGGHFWMDIKKGERINNLRVQQAVDVGADTIVTSCAYCMQMLEDSVKIMGKGDDLQVIDLATLTLESLER